MARVTLGKVLYGSAFVLVLPVLLVLWATAAKSSVILPTFGNLPMGTAFGLSGITIIAVSIRDLWRFGGGLPMNAFPPPNLVKRGTFRWIPHPIYSGFVITCLGISIAVRSPAGLWLVTPSVALCCAALVLGYEHPDMVKRFGATLHILPPDDDTRPSAIDRAHFFLCSVVPWIALYELTTHLLVPGTRFQFRFEEKFAVWPWTVIIYQSTYAAVATAPFCAQTRRDLRQLMISSWVATAVVFPFYWVLPSIAPRRTVAGNQWIVRLLRFERDAYPPLAAFPSFHVLWAVFVARLYRPRWVGIGYAVAVSASCITTGMHFVADVAAALLLAPAFLRPQRAWERMRASAERLANSWYEWRIGHIRIINYGVYAGLAGFVQLAIVMTAVGPGQEGPVMVTAIAGLVGAGLWAQWVEGSSRLRRPFGFYGGLIAVALTCLFFEERWLLLGAHCLAAPWMQAIGRLRCLVNGCCHGAPASEEIGIKVVNVHSRVTRLANLGGVPIHPTQLYSILTNIMLGSFLLRMWACDCTLALICGTYAIGNGCARFAEEAYRGEPQTTSIWGLRLYQWIAAMSVVAGAVLTSVNSARPHGFTPSFAGFAWAGMFGLMAIGAMGVDFPRSDRAFARLT